jgi:hypothetical protein
MRRLVIPAVMLSLFAVSCISIKTIQRVYVKTMSINDVLAAKEQIDLADNPAKRFQIESALTERFILLDDVVVKDVIPSADIDYQFYVLAQVSTPKGAVDLYIYSKDNATMASLEKGKTHIKALGDFRRFFKLIDNTYVKVDVGDADISIRK